MERRKIEKCPSCDSPNIDPGEYWFKYHTDRYLLCHSCGETYDNATSAELDRDIELRKQRYREIDAAQEEKDYQLYLKLKTRFKGRDV